MSETVTQVSETEQKIVRSRTCGCRDFYIAKLTQNDATGYVAGTPVKLARAIKAKVDEKWSSEKIYSDDGTEEVINSYIVENWFVIVGLIAVLTAGGYAVYVFVKMPSDKQLNKVREWLLYAVTKAEKELGGGTGQIKLRYVYDMFVARFTWLARVISFEAFSMMVDEALERMKKMLESNKAMQTLVSGEAGETVEKDM